MDCETFFGTIDVVMAKNWLKMVSNMLIYMELDDELNLRMATRLIDKERLRAGRPYGERAVGLDLHGNSRGRRVV